MPAINNLTNVHIYPSPFVNESRILKITQSLSHAKAFQRILIIATSQDGLDESQMLDDVRQVLRVRRRFGGSGRGLILKSLRTLEWSWRTILALRGVSVSCLNCHSLAVLPLCVVLKALKRSKLVYDTHELETEVAGSKGVRRIVSRVMERMLIRFVDEVSVVNQSIAEWYLNTYGLDHVSVIKNAPVSDSNESVPSDSLRQDLGISQDEILFLYIGMIGPGRGVQVLLNAFCKLPIDRHLVFMGYGAMVPLVKKYSLEHTNIHFREAVQPDQVTRYVASADVGLSIIEDICLSYRLCLPNKVLECVVAGVPVMVSDLPEMSAFIEKYDCGWKVSMSDEAIHSTVSSLTRDEIARKARGCIEACEQIGWHHEEAALLRMYETVLDRSLARSSESVKPAVT